jgi:ATP-dependent RNA helicase DeaD
MDGPAFASILGPALTGALEQRGFERLTTVQEAVLDPALAGRDLRITSQTGSGKTVAIGIAVRELVAGAVKDAKERSKSDGASRGPRVLVVAPTRELARQVEEELRWFFAALGARVASVTGGASYRDERRALADSPAVIVGTPGRLLDHLNRGGIDPSALGAVVLDEADRMLDLGFREDLEAILKYAPEGHRTHLISATFPRGVQALADRVQTEPAHVQGTPLGAANADIDHVVHLVDPYERVDDMVNLLLQYPDEQRLVFARTRVDVARIARELANSGFAVSSISGEMEQPERNRALADFKRGKLRVLVATDVAARGIDVQDITRVIHAEPPDDADSYTHRSGRTGRAGRKGQSAVLSSPSALGKTTMLLRRARVTFRIEPIPTADDIRRGGEDRVVAELSANDPEGFKGHDERLWNVAKRLASDSANVTRTIARLLQRTNFSGPTEPRTVRVFAKPDSAKPAANDRRKPSGGRTTWDSGESRGRRFEGARAGGSSDQRGGDDAAERAWHRREPRAGMPHRHESSSLRPDRAGFHRDAVSPTHRANGATAVNGEGPRRSESRAPNGHPPARPARGGSFVPFRVSWGGEQGADARRLLAMVCRRGEVRGADVGNIHVARGFSTVEIAANVADAFAETVARPDPRNPRVFIHRDQRASSRS